MANNISHNLLAIWARNKPSSLRLTADEPNNEYLRQSNATTYYYDNERQALKRSDTMKAVRLPALSGYGRR